VILYGGLERESPSGDSYVDFEFFQGPVALCGTPAVSPATHQPCTSFTGVRTPGDVIVSINFLKGGAIGDMQIRKFDGTINNYPSTPNSDAVGGGCFKADGTSGDDVCAFNNADTIGAGAWGAFDNHAGSITQLPANAFTEIGVDLTTVLGESPCISTFMAKTRSSASFTSELKDFAGPTTFSRCQPSTALTKTIAKVNTTAQPAGTRSVTAHVGDSITYAYTETNDGQDDLSQPNTTGGPTSTTDNGGWVTDNTCSPVLHVVGDGSTTANSLHNIGDLNNDNKLNVGEAWKFSCTLSNIQLPSTGNTITNVAIGHGKDPLIKISSTNTNPVDVTYCTSGPGTGGIGNNGLGQFCDLDERDSNTVTIIAPSTSLTKTAQVTVVYTFKETNTGNDPISSVAVTDAYASGHNTGLTGCTVAPVLGADLTHNVGDLNNNDKLDPASGGTAAETWTFRCTVTSTDGANVDVWDTGTGSGNDSTGTAVPSTNESDGVKTLVSHCSGPCS